MDARALLDRMAAAGLSVVAEGGRLQIQPAVKLTADLHAQVVALKPEVLALLAAPLPDDKPTPAAKVEIPAAEKVTPTPPKLSAQHPKKAAVASERKLQRQRQRRATRPRIDYYPSPAATKALDALRQRSAGNASTIIDRVLVGIGAETPEA